MLWKFLAILFFPFGHIFVARCEIVSALKIHAIKSLSAAHLCCTAALLVDLSKGENVKNRRKIYAMTFSYIILIYDFDVTVTPEKKEENDRKKDEIPSRGKF